MINIFVDGMIVISNKFLPKLKIKGRKKTDKPIADTATGDEAYYVTRYSGRKRPHDYESDSDDSSDSEEIGFSYGVSERSLTGADWRPVFNDRMTMFIAGTPGAGKSYLAKQMIGLLPETYTLMLFTALEENDGNFDDIGKDRMFKIKMTPEVLSNITLAEIRKRSKSPQTILLFDDVDKIRNSKVQNLVFALMNDVLANGRGHEKHDGNGDVHVICTSHSANDYQKTKYTFENSNYVALFPGTTPPLQMYRMFDKMGLEKELCMKMIKLAREQKIRSIIIHKVVPMYLIFGDKIMLL